MDNVFDALYDGEDAREIKRRAESAAVLEHFIERGKLSQLDAEKQVRVSQPRINDLLRGRLHRFSITALLMMDRVEIQVEFKVKFPKAAKPKQVRTYQPTASSAYTSFFTCLETLSRCCIAQCNNPLYPKTVNSRFQSAAFADVHELMAILKKAVGRVKRGFTKIYSVSLIVAFNIDKCR